MLNVIVFWSIYDIIHADDEGGVCSAKHPVNSLKILCILLDLRGMFYLLTTFKFIYLV